MKYITIYNVIYKTLYMIFFCKGNIYFSILQKNIEKFGAFGYFS